MTPTRLGLSPTKQIERVEGDPKKEVPWRYTPNFKVERRTLDGD